MAENSILKLEAHCITRRNLTHSRYVLTLMNVVSAIYSDPTLGANLQFVVTRVIKDVNGTNVNGVRDPIQVGNSKQSLANVNR